MYLWVIIATFITALFTLNMSLRTDIKQLYVVPQAEVVITKIYRQHEAALKYVSLEMKNANPQINGVIVEDDIKKLLPFGYHVGDFTSVAYCLNEDGTDLNRDPAPVPEGEDPDDPKYIVCSDNVYVVTYGRTPVRWRNLRTGKPNFDLLAGMHTKTGFVDNLGYLISKKELPSDEQSKYTGNTLMKVHGKEYYVQIPEFIINDVGRDGCLAESNCLFYMEELGEK